MKLNDVVCEPNPQAKAHEINQVGRAEAAAILAKGEAEAKVGVLYDLCEADTIGVNLPSRVAVFDASY